MNSFKILVRLFGIISSISKYLWITIITGYLGYLFAMSIPILGVLILASTLGWIQGLDVHTLIAGLVMVGLLRGGLRYLEHYFGHYVAFKTLALFRDKLFAQIRRISPSNLLEKEKGDLVLMASADIESLEVFYAHTIAPVSIALLMALTMGTVLSFVVSGWFALGILLCYSVLAWVLPNHNQAALLEPTYRYRAEFSKTNSHFLESIQGLTQTQYLQATSIRLNQMNQNQSQLETTFVEVKQLGIRYRFLADGMIYMTIFFSILIGLGLLFLGLIQPFQAILGTVIVMSSFGAFLAINQLPSTLNQTIAAAKRVFLLLDEVPVLPEVEQKNEVLTSSVSLENVSFSYDQSVIFKDLSIRFPEVGIVGIIGESGSGKTTLIRLIMRLFEQTDGVIYWGNQTIESINTTSLRKRISFMNQDTTLFEMSFKDNIILAKPFDPVLFNEVIELAHLQQVIDSLSQGIDTLIGRRYVQLSSGEKQRLGLARALYWGGDVFILDEPTSNVDAYHEAVILQTLNQLKSKRLIFLISHRLSTLSICDSIYRLEHNNLKRQ